MPDCAGSRYLPKTLTGSCLMPNQTTPVRRPRLETLALPMMATSSAPQNSRCKLFSLPSWVSVLLHQIWSVARLDKPPTHRQPDYLPSARVANRGVWASDYVYLRTLSPSNAALLDTSHSAAFVLCLGRPAPGDFLMTPRFLWQGAPNGLRDRWVDKPVQLIVSDSARVGFMGEHSVMDGTPTFAPTDAICTA